MSSTRTEIKTEEPRVLSAAEREQLRHPMERRIVTAVAVIDTILVAIGMTLLISSAEWLTDRPAIARYRSHGRILLIAVVAQEESIRISAAQLPEIHGVLVRQCVRVGIPVPDLFLSDGADHAMAFAWRGHNCIVLSSQGLSCFPEAFDDVVEFALAREVGSICLVFSSSAALAC